MESKVVKPNTPTKRRLSTTCSDDTDECKEFNIKAGVFAQPDLILKIGKTKLHVLKEHLTKESPVFERMFGGEFKEKDAQEIELPGKNPKDFVDFLRCTLPGIDDDFTEETVHVVLPLADEYQTKRTLTKADKFLQQQCRNLGNKLSSKDVIENIIEAEMYSLPSYLNECIDIAYKKYYTNLINNEKFEKISKDTRLDICLKRWESIDTLYGNSGIFKNSLFNSDKLQFFDALKPLVNNN